MNKKRIVSIKSTTQAPPAYPIFNTMLKSLPGERWKDMPGFEDLYQISNFGRVKSLDRWVDMGGFDQFREGRIIKLRASVSKKKNGKETHNLQMKLHKEKKRYLFSIARYVYFLFVASFDLDDHTVLISRKDGDILNCHYKNLWLRPISDIAKEGFASHKRSSVFQLQVKQVTQYSPYGKRIHIFKTAKEASESVGIMPNYISDAARTMDRTAGGYYWRYGKPTATIDISSYIKPLHQPDGKTGKPLPARIRAKHHFLNRNNEAIPGEKWKAVEGFEDAYEVSDHGRVRSLSRLKEVVTGKGNRASYLTRTLIRKQSVQKSINNYLGEVLEYLTVALKKDGRYYSFVVARLMYQLFGPDKPGLKDSMVVHKDGDNLNNHISNLELANESEVIKTAFEQGRRQSHFSSITPEERRKYAQATVKANYIVVSQYNLKGKRIGVYESLLAAAIATGVDDATISNAINGRYLQAGGFIWRRGRGEQRIDVTAIQHKIQQQHAHRRKKVAQLNLKGKKLQIFNSITEAARLVNRAPRQISEAVHGRSQTCAGYRWQLL